MNFDHDINKKELTKMTILSCDVVNSMNFSQAGSHAEKCDKFGEFLNDLETRYGDTDLLTKARHSFEGISRKKLDFYRFTWDMIRLTKEPLVYGKASVEQEVDLRDCA
ncbi:MAG: hypothetical protein P8Y12_13010 [Gammaproteobacteria bacterium]|jgi:hypothetical protein